MITEQHEFITAYFSDDIRRTVTALWADPETKEIVEEVIEARDGDAAWEHLLQHVTIDLLHELTFKYIKEQKEQLDEYIMKIAKEQGLVYHIDSYNTEIYKVIASSLFSTFDPDTDKEKLFMYKLQLFELDQIKENTNKSLKSKLRKAKTILEATKLAIQLVESTPETTKTEETSSPLDVD
jgi:hypothetical protein